LFHRVAAKTWYMKNTAASMLSTILRRLDVIWHCYIEWPLTEVGLLTAAQKVPDSLPTIGFLAL